MYVIYVCLHLLLPTFFIIFFYEDSYIYLKVKHPIYNEKKGTSRYFLDFLHRLLLHC